MKKLSTLRKVARDSAMWRGHKLSRFSPAIIQSTGKEASFARCLECGAGVAVDTRPLPQGIEISGTAVAINCNRLKTGSLNHCAGLEVTERKEVSNHRHISGSG